MSSEALTLVSAIDRHYLVPYSVMLTSFREYNPGLATQGIVIHWDLNDNDEKYINRVAEELGIPLTLIKIPSYPFCLFATRRRKSIISRRQMSPIVYAKAFLDRFVPDHISRAICLDADIIVQGDISALFTVQTPHPVAAVANVPRYHHHQFNSGFMLVDLEAWRRLRVADIAEKFLFHYSDALHTHDQQVLNLILGQRWQKLSLKWNYMEDYFRFRERVSAYTQAEIDAARENPIIVHYAVSADKPWLRDSEHPRANLYLKHRNSLAPLMAGLQLVEPNDEALA